ncbi:MAG TPA: hypothetical protein VI911_07535 [Patescibacteria group bacterium]|nr:hypothetical protein [Patescibacteria group bacterium]
MANKNSSNTNLTVSSAGAINYPSQPAFFAHLSSSVGNVTGDATVYTVLCDDVIYDQASNYTAGTGTFTAPVTGRYHFTAGLTISTIGVATRFNATISATSNVATFIELNPSTCNVGGILTVSGCCFINMNSGNTVTLKFLCSGTTKTVGVDGQATNPITWFSGMLVA